MEALFQALCFCTAAVASEPYPQAARPAWGDIWYTEERLGDGRHLLRLSTGNFFWHWEYQYDRSTELGAFARRYAAEACHGRYRLSDADRNSWPKLRPAMAKQFVFRCV